MLKNDISCDLRGLIIRGCYNVSFMKTKQKLDELHELLDKLLEVARELSKVIKQLEK
jgi:hypothetical protein